MPMWGKYGSRKLRFRIFEIIPPIVVGVQRAGQSQDVRAAIVSRPRRF
jgi:hypothetical protein